MHTQGETFWGVLREWGWLPLGWGWPPGTGDGHLLATPCQTPEPSSQLLFLKAGGVSRADPDPRTSQQLSHSVLKTPGEHPSAAAVPADDVLACMQGEGLHRRSVPPSVIAKVMARDQEAKENAGDTRPSLGQAGQAAELRSMQPMEGAVAGGLHPPGAEPGTDPSARCSTPHPPWAPRWCANTSHLPPLHR